eukprot:7237561-Pyramimonas_sp.AAC.1
MSSRNPGGHASEKHRSAGCHGNEAPAVSKVRARAVLEEAAPFRGGPCLLRRSGIRRVEVRAARRVG